MHSFFTRILHSILCNNIERSEDTMMMWVTMIILIIVVVILHGISPDEVTDEERNEEIVL